MAWCGRKIGLEANVREKKKHNEIKIKRKCFYRFYDAKKKKKEKNFRENNGNAQKER